MGRFVALLSLSLVLIGCAPWYARYGIKSEAELRRPEALPKLRQALRAEPWTVLTSGEPALVALGEPAAVMLVSEARSFYEYNLVRLFQVLGAIGSKRAVPTLIRGLADDTPEVRLAAVQALGQIGDPSPNVLEALNQVTRLDAKSDVKEAAALALRKLSMQVLAAGKTSAPVASGTKDKPAEVAKPATAAKGSTSIVAVFDIEDAAHRFDAATLDQLTEYLASKVAELGPFKVVPRDQIRARLVEEKRGTLKKCYDESCQLELGKALAAQKTLATKLLRVGNQCAITSNLYDLKSETAEAASSVETDCSTDALMTGIRNVVKRFASR